MHLPQFEWRYRGRTSRIQAVKLDSRVIYEGFWRRGAARLIDLALVFVTVATLALLGLAFGEKPSGVLASIADVPGLWKYGAWMLAALALAEALFWSFLGATPGKLLLGSQVVSRKSGRRLTFAPSVLRSLALWLGVACLGVGVLWILRDPRNQGLHDKLAGSLVVREDESLMALEELAENLK